MSREAAFVIGGADVYRQALPRADRIYLTRVEATPAGDVEFPDVDWSHWHLVEKRDFPADRENEYAHCWEVYRRRTT